MLDDLLERLGGSSSVKPNVKKSRTTKRVPVLTKGINAAFERYFDPRGELEIKALGLDTLVRDSPVIGSFATGCLY